MKRNLLAAGMALVFLLGGLGQRRGPRGRMGIGTAPGADESFGMRISIRFSARKARGWA